MTEIARRSPEDLRMLEAYPGEGLYDCMGLMDGSGRPLLSLTRSGTLRLHATLEGETLSVVREDFFTEMVRKGFPMSHCVHRLCAALRIPSYKLLPSTTPAILTYRYLAALLEQAALASRAWECRSGYVYGNEHGIGICDGMGAGERGDFSLFPLAKKRLRASPRQEHGGRVPAHAFWFLYVDGEPKLCLSEEGKVWDRDFNEADLVPAYAQRHRIWPLVTETAASVLP